MDTIHGMILRYLNGELGREEEAHLKRWRKESAANESELQTITKLWRDSGAAALQDFNTEKAWQNVYSQTFANESGVRRLFSWKTVAAAASVIIIAGGFYFYNRSTKITWTQTVATTSNKTVPLPDGSVVTLRKGSTLSLPDNFAKTSRQIKLSGEAYFEIRHNDQHPFSVITGKSLIQDIGTSFLVRSYDTVEQVTVMEGAVSFADRGEKEKKMELQGGESVVLKNGKPVKKFIENNNLLSWKTNTLVFANTPMQQVAGDIEDYYSVNVYFPAEISSVMVTAKFKDQPLEEVMHELHLFTGLSFKLKGHDLYISK